MKQDTDTLFDVAERQPGALARNLAFLSFISAGSMVLAFMWRLGFGASTRWEDNEAFGTLLLYLVPPVCVLVVVFLVASWVARVRARRAAHRRGDESMSRHGLPTCESADRERG